MQRLTYILILLIAAALPSFGRASQGGYCSQGGVTGQVSTGGFTVAPKMQASYPGCTVTVYLTGTLTLATIYSDSGGTGKANPFTADATTGYWFFYANNGRYDVKMNGGGIPTPFALGGIQLTDITSVTWTSPLVFSGNTASCPTCAVTNGSYADPSWITSLAYTKLTGQPWDLTGAVATLAAGIDRVCIQCTSTGDVITTLRVEGPNSVGLAIVADSGNNYASASFRSGGGGSSGDNAAFSFFQGLTEKWQMAGVFNGSDNFRILDSDASYVQRFGISGTTGGVAIGTNNTSYASTLTVMDNGGVNHTEMLLVAGPAQGTNAIFRVRTTSGNDDFYITYNGATFTGLNTTADPAGVTPGAAGFGWNFGVQLSQSLGYSWTTDNTYYGTTDLKLLRSTTSTMRVTNGAGGDGNVVLGDLTVNGTCTGCGGGGGGGVTLDTAQTITGQKTFSAAILASAGVIGTVFNSTVTGSTIAFQTLSGAGAQINGAGNISTAESIVATKFVTTSEWFGLPRYSTVEPTTDPSGTFSGLAYKGGTSGLEIWLWDDVNSAWSDIDLASVAGGLTSINGQTGPAITLAGVANRTTISQSMDTVTITLPQDIATTSSVTFGSVTSPGTFNSTIAGAGIAFQAGGGIFQVDGTGNISGAGNVIATGYVTSATWLGLKDYAATPGTTPGGTYSAMAYKGGTSGLEIWLWDDVNGAWSDIDLAGVAGGISSVNGQTGPGISIAGTANRVTVSTLANVVTLSGPQDLATTSNTTFASVTTNGVVQAVGSGSGRAFQTTTGGGSPLFKFIVDFDGNVSAFGQLNLTGAGNVFAIGGVTVINSSRNATVNNLTVSGTCTGCSGGVSSVNLAVGALSLLGTSSQVIVGTVGTNITLSLPQSIGTGNAPQFAGETLTGQLQFATGSGIRVLLRDALGSTSMQLDAAGSLTTRLISLNGGLGTALTVNGIVALNTSGAFVGAGVNVCSGFSTPCPNGVGARAFNPYDSSGTVWTGQDYIIGTSGGNLTVNGIPVTSIKFVGGSLVSYTP